MIPTTLTRDVETAAIFKFVVQIAFTQVGMSVEPCNLFSVTA